MVHFDMSLLASFRPHRIHGTRTIAIDVPAFVCLSFGFTPLRCVNTSEQIGVTFGVKTLGGPAHCVRRGPVPHGEGH